MNEARHGIVVDRRPSGGGPSGKLGTYVVKDAEDSHQYVFDYTDIVTEGFRTIRTGERVRFYLNQQQPWRAEFVLRLDQPDAEAFYE